MVARALLVVESWVSADGKNRTVHTGGTDAAGKKASGFAVYDKQ